MNIFARFWNWIVGNKPVPAPSPAPAPAPSPTPAPAPTPAPPVAYPAGLDAPDARGGVLFLSADKTDGGKIAALRFLWMGVQPFVPQDSEAWHNIDTNCATAKTLENMGGMSAMRPMATVKQPNGSWVTANPHVLLDGYGVIPAEHVTYDAALAYINSAVAKNTNPNGAGAGPFVPGQ